MPRKPRYCPTSSPSHVYQRGNDRGDCFRSEADLAYFANSLNRRARQHSVQIHAWVFMTNHFHLLVTPLKDGGVSRMMQAVGREYVPYYNDVHNRTGALFEGRFRSHVVETEAYLINCQRYIELNPVRAGMVEKVQDYAWSSYRAHAYGTQVELWSPHLLYLQMATEAVERQLAYRALFGQQLDSRIVDQIRSCTTTGKPLI